MAQGTVEWFSDDKGHGFVALDEGGDLKGYEVNMEVTFLLEE